MSTFIQLHLLTSYPPSNLNRDDSNRPKTALMGGALRLRVSSQSLKRAWRTSSVFEDVLTRDHVGSRSKLLVDRWESLFKENGIPAKDAKQWAHQMFVRNVDKAKGKASKKTTSDTPEESETSNKEDGGALVHYSQQEIKNLEGLAQKISARNTGPTKEELEAIANPHTAADIALFGRMLASAVGHNVEAACQVAHAITVHKTTIEDDFFTAVDDLKPQGSDAGAAHLGEVEFAAGLFYLYVCLDRDLLLKNLNNDSGLSRKTIEAILRCATTISPTGKQNSFASRARASYILCEKGPQQPRSLSVAFLKPVEGKDHLSEGIKALEKTRAAMDKAYGPCASDFRIVDINAEKGTLEELINFAARD